MRIKLAALLAFVLPIGQVFAADNPSSIAISLKKAACLKGEAGIQWEVALSNATSNALQISRFSLASAIRAAKFTNDVGHSWRVIPPKSLIDPPSPEIDFRLRIPAGTSTNFTFQTEGLECLSDDKSESKKPDHLHYAVDRDVDIIIARVGKSTRWKCVGNGIVEITW